jgi:hypothetical protein
LKRHNPINEQKDAWLHGKMSDNNNNNNNFLE